MIGFLIIKTVDIMRTLVLILLIFSCLDLALNQPARVSQLSLVSANKKSTSSDPNQQSTVPSSSTNSFQTSTTPTSPPPSTKSTSVIDIVPSSPSTYSDAMASSIPGRKPSPIHNQGLYNYQQANTLFQELQTTKNNCWDSAGTIKNMALRQHNSTNYLTSNQHFVSFKRSEKGPLSNQIFTALQNPDCTWSLRSKNGKFVSLNSDFTYLILVGNLGMKERFYLERKDSFIYIQSALNYRIYVNVINGIGMFGINRASRFVMEVWPELSAGWN